MPLLGSMVWLLINLSTFRWAVKVSVSLFLVLFYRNPLFFRCAYLEENFFLKETRMTTGVQLEDNNIHLAVRESSLMIVMINDR